MRRLGGGRYLFGVLEAEDICRIRRNSSVGLQIAAVDLIPLLKRKRGFLSEASKHLNLKHLLPISAIGISPKNTTCSVACDFSSIFADKFGAEDKLCRPGTGGGSTQGIGRKEAEHA